MRLVLVLLMGLTGLAHADVYASKAGKVSVDIPKKWSVNATDELIRAASPDSQVAFVFWVVEKPDVKAALTKLEGELYNSIQGLKWVDKTKKLKINGMAATWVEGLGVNAAENQLDVLVVVAGPTKTKKGVLMLAVVEHDKLKANQKSIQGVFQTLKATK
ncbi:MAG TPA: hypothetical protein VL326_24245 [Kofleriaceae bacterium]|jgi:hypothetical protein|nr:hypothetical protein [Kofleriaceae bacterium]